MEKNEGNQWTRIEDGLPTDEDDYWVTIENGMGEPKVTQALYDADAGSWWKSHKYSLAEADLDEWAVTAFQPIIWPAPYQEQGEPSS